jgi:hypothetical protein
MNLPTERCPKCKKDRAAHGFTVLSSGPGTDSETLCSACFNEFAAKRIGVPVPDPVEFAPIALHDAIGKAHTFYFEVRLSTGLGIKAFEWINGEPGGYTFQVLLPPDAKSTQAYDKLVAKIKSALKVRYIRSSDFDGGMNRLYIKGSAINGRIDEKTDDDGESKPIVVVDGQEYSWEEFGQCLSPYNGFNFRLECFDAVDEMPTDPEPKRPDPCWWLKKQDHTEDESSYH